MADIFSEKKKPGDKKSIAIAILSILIAVLVFLFLIRPLIKGYGIYSKLEGFNLTLEEYAADIEELRNLRLVAETNLSSCYNFNEKLLAEVKEYASGASECKSALEGSKTNFSIERNIYGQRIADLNADIGDKDNKIDELESGYDALAKNSANNICCKAKVDNPKIRSYIVENNKVICMEEGGVALGC